MPLHSYISAADAGKVLLVAAGTTDAGGTQREAEGPHDGDAGVTGGQCPAMLNQQTTCSFMKEILIKYGYLWILVDERHLYSINGILYIVWRWYKVYNVPWITIRNLKFWSCFLNIAEILAWNSHFIIWLKRKLQKRILDRSNKLQWRIYKCWINLVKEETKKLWFNLYEIALKPQLLFEIPIITFTSYHIGNIITN